MKTSPSQVVPKVLLWFLAAWTGLNLLQAAVLNVDADEAYYWFYATRLQWGYFDHPPLVALLVRLGETFGHGSLFTRLGTVLLSAGSVYFACRALPDEHKNLRTFLLAFASVVLFHVYGFIATPDAGLLFFTALFFFRYKRYLQRQSFANVLLLALSIAGMLYSKYHGVLPVFFVFLSNPRLALKPTAWLVVALAAAAFLPHLWWQYQHDWPTFRYHLYERVSGGYRLDKTTTYLLIQLLIWGPLSTAPALYFLAKQKRRYDAYLRAHLFTFFGIFVFFLFSSFRVSVQGQWVLAAGPSFVVLLCQLLDGFPPARQRLFRRLLRINVGFILLLRALLFVPGLPLQAVEGLRAVLYGRQWANEVYKQAAGRPVVFADSYAWPSLYRYYHPAEQAIGYSSVDYRKSQYTLARADTALHGKTVWLAAPWELGQNDAVIRNVYTETHLSAFANFQAVTPLTVTWKNKAAKAKAGERLWADVVFSNTGPDTVHTQNLSVGYVFLKTRHDKIAAPQNRPFAQPLLPPGYQKQTDFLLQAPDQPGVYFLIFTVVQPPLAGSFASVYYKIEVE